jgi:hypothetical protein
MIFSNYQRMIGLYIPPKVWLGTLRYVGTNSVFSHSNPSIQTADLPGGHVIACALVTESTPREKSRVSANSDQGSVSEVSLWEWRGDAYGRQAPAASSPGLLYFVLRLLMVAYVCCTAMLILNVVGPAGLVSISCNSASCTFNIVRSRI